MDLLIKESTLPSTDGFGRIAAYCRIAMAVGSSISRGNTEDNLAGEKCIRIKLPDCIFTSPDGKPRSDLVVDALLKKHIMALRDCEIYALLDDAGVCHDGPVDNVTRLQI